MRILLVEDDPDLSRQLKQALGDAGYAVDHAPDGEEAHFLGETEPYDAIVLDLGLPKIDGVSVLERWRRDGRSHAGADPDRPRRLEREGGGVRRRRRRLSDQALPHRGAAGAPARPAAPLGRPRGAAPRPAARLRLDPRAARATVNGEPLRLTSLEYRLLHYLMMHQGRVISRTELVEHLYDQDFDRDSNTIEVFVGRLRKKIGADRIETVRGLGYRLVPLAGEPAEA